MNFVYLDNGATSYPKAPGVAESMSDFILNIGVNVGREPMISPIKQNILSMKQGSYYVNFLILINQRMLFLQKT